MTLTDRDLVRHSNRQYRSACVDDVLPLIKTVLIKTSNTDDGYTDSTQTPLGELTTLPRDQTLSCQQKAGAFPSPNSTLNAYSRVDLVLALEDNVPELISEAFTLVAYSAAAVEIKRGSPKRHEKTPLSLFREIETNSTQHFNPYQLPSDKTSCYSLWILIRYDYVPFIYFISSFCSI